MGALCAAALLLQVLLVTLPLSLRQAESGRRARRSSQDILQGRPPGRAVAQAAGETQGLQPHALPFVVLRTEGQDGLQPLSLLWKDSNSQLSNSWRCSQRLMFPFKQNH